MMGSKGGSVGREAKLLGLRQQMMRLQGLIAVFVVVVLSALYVVLIHVQVHRQTDALLIRLAQQDASDIDHEQEHGIHLHDGAVSLPSNTDHFASKVGLVLDSECRVRATAALPEDLLAPPGFCEVPFSLEPQMLNLSHPEFGDFRMACIGLMLEDGTQLRVMSGVQHEDVDSSTWHALRVAVPAGLVALLLLTGGSWLAALRVSRDLEALSAWCESLGPLAQSRDVVPPTVVGRPLRETSQLQRTLLDLLRRMQASTESRERFLAEAAHDLRTPLTSLGGDLEVTLRRPRTAAEYEAALRRALEDTHRLGDLAEHLLDTARSREEALTLTRLDLAAVVRSVVNGLQHVLQHSDVRLLLELPGELWAVADERSITRVLNNLVGNVAHHAPGSRLKISARSEPGRVLMRIEDDGPGLPAEVESSLFEAFSRGSSQERHGLGLYIAQMLVQRQNGELRQLPTTQGLCWELCLPC